MTTQKQDMADMVSRVLASAEDNPEKLAAAAEAIGMTAGELIAMAQFSQSQREAEAKSAHKIQLFSSMRRVLIAPASKAGGDYERRLRVTAWSQVRRTEQYANLRGQLAKDIEALITKYAEIGESAIANTRVLVDQGVVELRGKDRKSDEDED